MERFEPIVSTLNDRALRPAVTRFAAGLSARLAAVERCLAAADEGRAAHLLHQLAGAAGMHGFMPIAEAAQAVERALRQGDAVELENALRALGSLCARVRAV